jgi:hypothetical protein
MPNKGYRSSGTTEWLDFFVINIGIKKININWSVKTPTKGKYFFHYIYFQKINYKIFSIKNPIRENIFH